MLSLTFAIPGLWLLEYKLCYQYFSFDHVALNACAAWGDVTPSACQLASIWQQCLAGQDHSSRDSATIGVCVWSGFDGPEIYLPAGV